MKKDPLRKCVGCREMKPKSTLCRIVQSENIVNFDPSGKMAGRGAYVCRSRDCFDKARKTKGLERSLKSVVSDDVFTRLASCMDIS